MYIISGWQGPRLYGILYSTYCTLSLQGQCKVPLFLFRLSSRRDVQNHERQNVCSGAICLLQTPRQRSRAEPTHDMRMRAESKFVGQATASPASPTAPRGALRLRQRLARRAVHQSPTERVLGCVQRDNFHTPRASLLRSRGKFQPQLISAQFSCKTVPKLD